MKLISLDWSMWFYGMWVAIATGSANSVLAGLTLKLMDDAVFNRSFSKFLGYIGILCMVGAVKDFFLYISVHPAPQIISQQKSVFITPSEGTGDGSIKTTIEKKVEAMPPKEGDK